MIDFGTLHLPTSEPAALAAAEWTDWPVHGWMLVACAAIILFSLPEINKILPAMAGCLARSRGNLEIEHSLSTARSRNTIARLLGLVFIVDGDSLHLATLDAGAMLGDNGAVGACLCTLATLDTLRPIDCASVVLNGDGLFGADSLAGMHKASPTGIGNQHTAGGALVASLI